MTCSFVGPLNADPDGPGGPLTGGQIVVEYDATPLPSSEILSPTSFDAWEPDTIRNTVSAVDYTEVLSPGPNDNHFTAGQSVTRASVHTPVPNVEVAWVVNSLNACPASVGAGRDALLQVDVTNGDKYTRNSNGAVTGLVYGFEKWPVEDLNPVGSPDGILDKGVLYNPAVSVTIPASASYDPLVNVITASGPDAPTPSDNFSVYTAIAAPDTVTVNANGTTTLTWNALVPSLRPNPNASVPAPSLRLRIGLTTAGAGGAWATGSLSGEDGSGAGVRGENVDSRFAYAGSDSSTCYPPTSGGGGGGGGGGGTPPPDHSVSKTPDVANNVLVTPGEVFNFTITLTQSRTAPLTGVSFQDDLPSGLTYAGSLNPAESGYAVATISPLPAGWTSLQDYYTDTIPTTAGRTRARWTTGMPDLPKGTYTITFPAIAAVPALHPDEFVTNRATLNSDQGNRFDDGAVKTVASTQPKITKRVDQPTRPYSTDTEPQYFTFTSDITLPAAYRGYDLIVTDFPNISNGPGFTYGVFNDDYDRPPLKIEPGGTVTCIAGCTGAVDTLTATRLGDAPFTNWDKVIDPLTGLPNYNNNTTIWPDHHYDYRGPWNAMTGWYIGDVNPDPEGQDRILRFTYQIKAPTVQEMYDLAVARRIGTWTTQTILDNPTYVKALSSFEYTNYVQLSMQNANRNWDVSTFNPDWTAGYNPLELTHGGSRTWINATVDFKVEYPVLEIEKQCGSADGKTDRDVPNTPALPPTPNTRCEITVRNISDVQAFDVVLSEDPGNTDEFFQGYTSPADGRIINRSGTSMTGTARAVPGNQYSGEIGRPNYLENGTLLTLQQPELEDAEWNFDLNPGETKKFSYELRLDGFSNMPAQWFEKDNQASDVGVWDNLASVDSFSATDGGSPVFEQPITAADGVTFTRTYIGVSKFPAQPGRTTADLRPFNVTSTQFATNSASDGGHYNWWGHSNPYGNNYGGGWYDQPDADPYPPNYVDDPLAPYALRRTDMDDIWNSRGVVFMRQVDEECGTRGWNQCGIYYSANLGSNPDRTDLWNLSLDNPDNWAPSLIAHPTEDYRWGIDLRVDGLKNLDTISIADRLPFGWTYKPGSAELIDADWNVGYSGQTDTNPDHDPTTADSLARIPIADPVIDTSTATAVCNPANYGETGPTLTWTFDKAGTTPDPWDTLYLDAGTWSRLANHDGTGGTTSGFAYSSGNAQYEAGAGSVDRYNWVRLEFTAVPDGSVVTCDPDTTNNIKPFFQENNTTVTASSNVAGSPALSSTYAMIVPVKNPVTLTKTPDNAYTTDDKIVNYTVTFTNNLDVDVTNQDFTDRLVLSGINKNLPNPPNPNNPVVPTYLDPSNHVCATTTADKAFSETQCVVTETNATTRTYDLTWNVPLIAAGESVTFTIPVIIAYEENNLASIDNRVTTIVDEYHDQVLTDVGDFTVINASRPPNPTKSVVPSTATINDTVTYTIRWTAGVTMAFNDLLYSDIMPDGLELVSLGNVTCSGGCPKSAASVLKMTPEPQPDGTTQLGWWFGDMAGSNTASTWTMTYTARVLGSYKADGSRVTTPINLVNTVQGASNKNNTLSLPPANIPVGDEMLDWLWQSVERTATVLVREPNIVVSKTATVLAPGVIPAQTGDVIQFSVTARNTGAITAYGVNMVDTPDPRSLKDIVMAPRTGAAPVGSVAVNGWTLIDPQIAWYIPAIAPNGTATFTYTAVVNSGYLAAGVTEAYNEADVTAFRARPGVNPHPLDRLYTEVENVQTATPLGAPKLRAEKFVDGCTDESLATARYTDVTWCAKVTNDGTVGAINVTARDLLPSGWTYQAGSTTGTKTLSVWTATEPVTTPQNNLQLAVWTIGSLAPGETATIEFKAVSSVRAPLKATNVITAIATLADGSDAPLGAPGYRSSDPADVTLQVYGLEIEKLSKEQTKPLPTDKATWDLVVRNPGLTALTNVVVVDNLPQPFTYLTSTSTDPQWSFTSAAAVGSGPGGTQPVTWAISRLEPGESVTIALSVNVPPSGIPDYQWYQNEVGASATEVADMVVNTSKIRFFQSASIGDRVWADTDADGVQDASEIGVPGVMVHLLDGSGNQLYLDPASGVYTTDVSAGFPAVEIATDGDGKYLFDGLPAGDYKVKFDPPAGLALTFQDRFGDDDADSDADRVTGISQTVSVVGGDAIRNVDAGLIVGNNSIGDRVWSDANGDGIQDDVITEPGLPGVKVILYNADTGQALQEVITDGLGNYLFANLPDGKYEVRFELDPANAAHNDLVVTWPGKGTDVGVDSNADRATGRSGVIDLDSAGTDANPVDNLTVDAGYTPKASLGDRVWNDIDGDGIDESGELGIEGVLVELLDPAGNVLATRTTGPNGEYLFADIPAGDYQVRFTRPAGYNSTPQGVGDPNSDSNADVVSGLSGPINLSPGESDLSIDAGFYVPVKVGGPIWDDLDGDGVIDPGETPLEGVVVALLNADGTPYRDSAGDPVTTLTKADGTFLFENLPPGQYKTAPVPPAGMVWTKQEQGDDRAIDSNGPEATSRQLLGGESDLTLGGGFYTPVKVGGPIWHDENHDGIQQPGEETFPNVVVSLLNNDGTPYRDAGGNAVTVLTGPDGRFLFEGLPPGQYKTSHGQIPGFVQTKSFQGSDPNADSNGKDAQSALLASGGSDLTLGSGWVRPVSVGGPIWEDLNGDGIIDPGEPPIEGVVVALLNADGTPYLDEFNNPVTTLTKADGTFLFENLPPGSDCVQPPLGVTQRPNVTEAEVLGGCYKTAPVPPAGMIWTKQEQGDDRAIDSNGPLATAQNLPPGASDLTLGGGFVRPVSVGGPIWEDANHDGIQQPGEPTFPGVVVSLLNNDGTPYRDAAGNPVTTTTGPDGRFLFQNLPPGQYKTSHGQIPGFVQTKSFVGSDPNADSNGKDAQSRVLTPGGSDLTLGSGWVRPVTVGGPIWEDTDGDGVMDADESPIPGVTVRLLHKDGTPVLDAAGHPVTTITGSDGRFVFSNLPPGEYITVPVPPEGWMWTLTGQGSDRNNDSNGPNATSGNLAPGGSDLTLGGGFVRPVKVGGPIWRDLDRDGVIDIGEPPIPGIVVRLLHKDGTPVLDSSGNPITTTTGADGRFEFSGLLPGEYVTAPVPPANLVWTLTGQGNDRDIDSNGPNARSRNLKSGEADLTLGGGFYDPTEILPTTGGDPWQPLQHGLMLLILGAVAVLASRLRFGRPIKTPGPLPTGPSL